MTSRLSLILIALLPFQFVLPLIWGWDIPLARLLAAMILVSFFIGALLRRSWRLPAPLVTGAIVSFLTIALASCLWAAQPGMTFPKSIFLLNMLPLIFVWYDLMRDDRERQRLLGVFILGAAGAAIVGIGIFLLQFVFGVGETFHFLVDRILPFFLGRELAALVASYPSLLVNIDGETVLRVTAFFPDPHVAAYFFGMSGFLALGMARQSGHRGFLLAATVLFLADILSFSRGGYIGLIGGGLVYFSLAPPIMLTQRKLRLNPGLLAALLVFAIILQPVASRFLTSFSLVDTSSVERLSLWREALTTIAEHPVWGVGLGNYLSSARPLYAAGTPFYAHNLYLDIALEVGLMGLLAFLMLFIFAFVQALQRGRRDPLAPAVAAILALYLTHSIFETALFSLHVTIALTFVLALALRLKRPIA